MIEKRIIDKVQLRLEDLARDLKTLYVLSFQWDCYKSIAMIQLVKTDET
jgi:hypothetical protein